ncbi:MAG: hypothetical protein EBS12_06465, partial [Flavobacteriia bacterium]|nr:hypothetical protein [Flavobacteriia bacterium]
MTKKLLFILALTFAVSVKAQNIPNAGFESWTPGFGYEDPNSWGTLNAASILGMPISVTKSTERHGGAFSAKVETMSTIDSTGQETPSPGFMFIGSVNILQQTGVLGTSFTARPDSLVGWVKCNSVNGDTSGIALQLTKWDAIALTQEQLGFGSFITTSTSTSFYRFSVPIEYVSENTPDSISVFVLSSIGNGQIGSAIWVDDLSLIYNTSSIGELNSPSFEVFPNPVNDELSISSKTVDKMEVYSATGILINHILIDSGLVASY